MSNLLDNFTNPLNTPFVESVVGFQLNDLQNKNLFETHFSTLWILMAAIFLLTIASMVGIAFLYSICTASSCTSPKTTNNKVEDFEMTGKM